MELVKSCVFVPQRVGRNREASPQKYIAGNGPFYIKLTFISCNCVILLYLFIHDIHTMFIKVYCDMAQDNMLSQIEEAR